MPDPADLHFGGDFRIPTLGERVVLGLPDGLFDGVVEKYRLSFFAGQVEVSIGYRIHPPRAGHVERTLWVTLW